MLPKSTAMLRSRNGTGLTTQDHFIQDPMLNCPECNANIPLTASLAAPLIAAECAKYQAQRAADQAKFESQIEKYEADNVKQEETLRKQRQEIEKRERLLDEHLARRLEAELPVIQQAEAKKAQKAAAAQLSEQLSKATEAEKRAQAYEADILAKNKQQAQLMRELREAKAQTEALPLEIEKGIHAGLAEAKTNAKKAAEESLKLQIHQIEQSLADRNAHVATLEKTINELKRRSEQGSQQAQGEVQEQLLEAILRERFPIDSIEPVAKGAFGGDVLQQVYNSVGQRCGSILWESKRTKSWQDNWLAKLRDDQRTAKADIGVIVSQVRPKEIDSFQIIDGIWVVSWHVIIPFTIAMRVSLLELSKARRNKEGQQTKTELVYQYLTGPDFRHRVTALIEVHEGLRKGLDKEKAAINRAWAVRDKQHDQMIASMSGLWGDLQGIAGQSLHELEGLKLESISAEEHTELDQPALPGI